jgi:hypothetical protein
VARLEGSNSPEYDLTGIYGAQIFRDLAEGLKIKLTTGAIAEIVGNPNDGGWLLVKIVEDSENPANVGQEQAVFYPDVEEVVT